ncbi:MAG: hypothetical protein H7Z20_01770 [Bdellovibrio sp.]|nr:hypothetical protein [Methylotenera sp.]
MKTFIQKIFNLNADKHSHSLTAWVDQLEEMSDLNALQFATQQLVQLINPADDAETLALQQQYDFILNLEALNFSRLEKLSTQFSSVENMKLELENSICEICYNYFRQTYIFQLKIIEQIAEHSKAQQVIALNTKADHLTLLVARTLYAAFNMVKWRMFSQANPPAKVWLQINVLYRFSAQRALLNNTVAVFNHASMTTLSALFVQIYMLGQLTHASMHKYQLEIATRVISALLSRARISDKFTPEHYLFCIDLQQDAPAKRIRDPHPSGSFRYWELDELEKLLTVAVTVSDRGEIPQSLALAKIDNVKKLNETLHILLAEWKKTGYVRQRRKITRQASSKTARVESGINEICNQVKQANLISGSLHDGLHQLHPLQSHSFDERLRLQTSLRSNSLIAATSGTLDTWMITDESPHGLGVRVNKYANILARPDKLIGLMIENETTAIVIGMIRSVKPTQGNQLRVGVQIISHHPSWVQLKRVDNNEVFANTNTNAEFQDNFNAIKPSSLDMDLFSGIYLPIEGGLSDTSCLILPKIYYRANATYSVTIAGVAQNVKLGEPIESHDDWVKLEFPF